MTLKAATEAILHTRAVVFKSYPGDVVARLKLNVAGKESVGETCAQKLSLIRRSKGNPAISGGQTRQRRRKLSWSLKSLIFSRDAAGSTSGLFLVLASPSVSHTTQCVCVCVRVLTVLAAEVSSCHHCGGSVP